MQKALKIDTDYSLSDLNRLLQDGWKVVNSCPMPSSASITPNSFASITKPTCLVIISDEK